MKMVLIILVLIIFLIKFYINYKTKEMEVEISNIKYEILSDFVENRFYPESFTEVEMEPHIWEFVEDWYPNYHSSDRILYHSDLSAYLDDEIITDSITKNFNISKDKKVLRGEVRNEYYRTGYQIFLESVKNYTENK